MLDREAVLDYLEGIINGLDSQLDVRTALELSVSAAPKKIRKNAEMVLSLYRQGRSLYDSFILAGFPKEYFFLLKPFEQEGNVGEGLKAVKELLEVDATIEKSLHQIDLYFLFLIILSFATLLVMFGYFIPVMAKLLSEILNGQKLDSLSAWLLKFKGKTIKDIALNPYFLGSLGISLFIWKTRLYRKFMVFLPAYRRLLKLSDKTAIVTALYLSKNYAQTINALAETYREKYGFNRIRQGFRLGRAFNSFIDSDLFDSVEERNMFILAGNNNFPSLFNYLRKKYDSERNKAYETVKTIVEFFMLFFVIGIIVAMAVLMVAPMKTIMQNING